MVVDGATASVAFQMFDANLAASNALASAEHVKLCFLYLLIRYGIVSAMGP